MEIAYLYGTLSVIAVSLVSLVGIFTLSMQEKLLQRGLFVLVSLAVGALLGDAIIHLIPESFENIDSALASLYILLGLLMFFVLEKFLRWHHSHGIDSEDDKKTRQEAIKPVGFLIIISDGIHNLVDGIIIGASYLVSVEVGVATTIAVILHEIPQEIGDFGLLVHAGFSRGRALFVNFLSALLAVAGVGIAFTLGGIGEGAIAAVLAFAAGGFLYIAGSDLVPELHKTHDIKTSLGQLAAIVVGIALMFALLFAEGEEHDRELPNEPEGAVVLELSV